VFFDFTKAKRLVIPEELILIEERKKNCGGVKCIGVLAGKQSGIHTLQLIMVCVCFDYCISSDRIACLKE
jgi:hypothetical protein